MDRNMSIHSEIQDLLDKCGISGSEQQQIIDSLDKLRENLQAASEEVNLTRLTEPVDFWTKHVADSLSVLAVSPDLRKSSLKLADIGPGAGFPMLPLALTNHNLTVYGIEPAGKKADFIDSQINTFSLSNCCTVRMSAKEASHNNNYRGSFDIIVARAVAQSDKLIKESRLLLRSDTPSRIVLFKTPEQIENEKKLAEREARKFKLKLNTSQPIQLPLNAGWRQFFILQR